MAGLIALSARRELSYDRDRALTPVFWQAAALIALVWLPVTGYFWLAYPDWELSYILDSRKLPPGSGLGAALAYLIAGLAGALSVQALIQEGRTCAAASLVLAGALVLGGVAFVTLDRLLFLGTYEAFHQGLASPPSYADRAFAVRMLACGAIVTLAFGGLLVMNLRRGRVLASVVEGTP